MRILNIRFRNLNSLFGDWEIDLTHEEYGNGGLFAITGPTGAGKSTILDAICLALYGSTPRLGNISKTSNEIMSRRTGDCYAEVSFEVGGERYRCCWRQHRAHKKPEGELQPPRHELFKDGVSQAFKIRDVAKEVENITGLTFERFLQSSMLAQGRFAAFLSASSSERAPLLEQITRTEIYSDLSKHIYQRCKAEQDALNSLDTALGSCTLLSEEEELALKQEEDALSDTLAELTLEEKRLNTEAEALNRLQALQCQHDQLLHEYEACQKARDAFIPQQLRLDTARRALLFSGACAAHLTQEEELAQDTQEVARLHAMLAPLREERTERQNEHLKASAALNDARSSLQSLMEKLKPVRVLDARLTLENERLTQANAAQEQAKKASSSAKQRTTTLGEEKALCQKNAEAVSAWLSAHQEDAALAEHLAVLQTHTSTLEQQQTRVTERADHLAALDAALTAKAQETALRQREHNSQREALNLLDERIAQLELQSHASLNGQNRSDWQRKKEALFQQNVLLTKAQETLFRKNTVARLLRELDTKIQDLQLSVVRERSALAAGQEALSLLQTQRKELEGSLRLMEKLRSLEEERRHLEEGQPCPLCGSLHHPYAQDTLPSDSDIHERLLTCENALEARTQELNTRISQLAVMESDISHTQERKAELTKEQAEHAALLERSLTELSSFPGFSSLEKTREAVGSGTAGATHRKDLFSALVHDDGGESLAVFLADIRQKTEAELQCIEAMLNEYSQLEEQLANLREARNNANVLAEDAARLLLRAEHENTALQGKRGNALQELERERAHFETLFDALRHSLLAYGLTVRTLEELSPALVQLAERRELFLSQSSQEEALRQKLMELGLQLQNAREQETQAALSLSKCEAECLMLEAQLRELSEQRQVLFGSLDTDSEEHRAEQNVTQAEVQADAAAQAFSLAEKTEADVAIRCEAQQKRIAVRAPQLEEQKRALLERLTQSGFASIQDCLKACLNEQERQTLETQERTLREESVRLEATLEENRKEAEELSSRSSMELPELEERLLHVKESIAEKRERMGALRQQLEHGASQRALAADTLEKKQKQEKIYRRWADLNELIGSADGKKFRNFAQGLTFQLLLGHANRQLALMTDRYVLRQNEKEALKLDVVDRYQADAVRSSRSLSGGESFLVSLSLALGLAQMAGRNVRVDSVFLDEGFGSLDEDALNLALDMLASLRDQGKCIGLISHVPAIRERIGVRIEVEPEGGGRSRLTGPGIQGSARV